MAREADGRHHRGPTWGSLEVWVERYGAVRYRLTVFPPGTDTVTRRWLRAWHAWCGVALVGAVGLALALTILLPPAAAFAVTGCLYLAGWPVIRRGAGAARRQTRRAIGVDLGTYSSEHERDRCGRLLRAAAALDAADRALRAGALTSVGHEAVWGRVYEQIGCLISEEAPLHVGRPRELGTDASRQP
jgi:hypothetical protein